MSCKYNLHFLLQRGCPEGEGEGGEEGGRDLPEPGEVQEQGRELTDSSKRDEGG